MGGAQGGGPTGSQILKIWLARFDPVIDLCIASVRTHDKEIDGQADTQIRAHGRIHGDQSDLQRIVKFGVVSDSAIKHRLAIFVLANLQIGRVYRALDEITGRVDHEKLQTAALDLAAEQKGDVVLN